MSDLSVKANVVGTIGNKNVKNKKAAKQQKNEKLVKSSQKDEAPKLDVNNLEDFDENKSISKNKGTEKTKAFKTTKEAEESKNSTKKESKKTKEKKIRDSFNSFADNVVKKIGNKNKSETKVLSKPLSDDSLKKCITGSIVDIDDSIVSFGEKYLGYNEADKSYLKFTEGREEAWCADFATYVVNEYADEYGYEVKEGFGSCAVKEIKEWGIKNDCYIDVMDMTKEQKEDLFKNELGPGDLIIWKTEKKGAMSHVGFIKDINDDGTFTTLEGNTHDQVASNVFDMDDWEISGYIKLSDVLQKKVK